MKNEVLKFKGCFLSLVFLPFVPNLSLVSEVRFDIVSETPDSMRTVSLVWFLYILSSSKLNCFWGVSLIEERYAFFLLASKKKNNSCNPYRWSFNYNSFWLFLYHRLSGWLNKNCVAKVYVLSFFFARSSLPVPVKISTLGFQLR